MRLIDADAIVFTHAIARSIDDGHNWNELCVTKDEIDDMPSAEPERKWTPVTEKLPWTDTNVLVTVLDDSGDTPWSYTSIGWLTPDGKYWVVDNEVCYGVVAWMPLPEPWRGE